MTTGQIALLGAGDQARVIADALEAVPQDLSIVLVDKDDSSVDKRLSYPRLKWSEFTLSNLTQGVVACGDNWKRSLITQEVLKSKPGFQFINVIHPSAIVSRNAQMGVGNVILAAAVVGPGTVIGNHCLINTRASIDHDCHLGEFSSIGPGAVLGGSVTVGAFCIVALGACILHSRRLAPHSLVGAGATVVEDVPEKAVSFGVPARVVRYRKESEPYL